MDRRLMIAMGYLVLALVALAAAGLLGPAGVPAVAGEARLPRPAPCPMTERPQALSVISGDASVAWQALAPQGMSGEFAHTHFA